jgi:hypothetical protein
MNTSFNIHKLIFCLRTLPDFSWLYRSLFSCTHFNENIYQLDHLWFNNTFTTFRVCFRKYYFSKFYLITCIWHYISLYYNSIYIHCSQNGEFTKKEVKRSKSIRDNYNPGLLWTIYIYNLTVHVCIRKWLTDLLITACSSDYKMCRLTPNPNNPVVMLRSR